MGASLMQPSRRVYEEGSQVVSTFSGEEGVEVITSAIDVTAEKTPANSVPAAR